MSSRNLKIALFASLAVNLFAIGAVVGGVVVAGRMTEGRLDAVRPGPPAFFRAVDSLPPARQDDYRQALRGEAGEVRRQLRAAGEARRAAWRGLADEPLNPAEVRRSLVAAQALEAEARGAIEGRVVDFAAQLTPEERRRFAEALAEPPRRRHDRRDGGRDPERPGS